MSTSQASYTWFTLHDSDVIMGAMAFQITSLTIVYSTVYSGADQIKHQSSASLALVCRIHWWPITYPHKWPVPRKMFPFDDVIMLLWFSIVWWLQSCPGAYDYCTGMTSPVQVEHLWRIWVNVSRICHKWIPQSRGQITTVFISWGILQF